MGDDILDLSREKETLEIETGFDHENCSEESKAKLLRQFINEKRANLLRAIMEGQMVKH